MTHATMIRKMSFHALLEVHSSAIIIARKHAILYKKRLGI